MKFGMNTIAVGAIAAAILGVSATPSPAGGWRGYYGGYYGYGYRGYYNDHFPYPVATYSYPYDPSYYGPAYADACCYPRAYYPYYRAAYYPRATYRPYYRWHRWHRPRGW